MSKSKHLLDQGENGIWGERRDMEECWGKHGDFLELNLLIFKLDHLLIKWVLLFFIVYAKAKMEDWDFSFSLLFCIPYLMSQLLCLFPLLFCPPLPSLFWIIRNRIYFIKNLKAHLLWGFNFFKLICVCVYMCIL